MRAGGKKTGLHTSRPGMVTATKGAAAMAHTDGEEPNLKLVKGAKQRQPWEDENFYEAFRKVNYHRRKLLLRLKGAEGWDELAIPYNAVKYMTHDGIRNGSRVICLVLHGDIARVEILGDALQELHYLLLEDHVEWIQEFDGRRADWQVPEKGKAYIERIRLTLAPRQGKKHAAPKAGEAPQPDTGEDGAV